MGGKNERFSNYARLIKTSSNVKDKVFHPIMMRMESDPTETELENSMRSIMRRNMTNPIENDFYPIIMKMNASRRAESGMVSMDFILSKNRRRRRTNIMGRTFNMLESNGSFSINFTKLRLLLHPKKLGDDIGLDQTINNESINHQSTIRNTYQIRMVLV